MIHQQLPSAGVGVFYPQEEPGGSSSFPYPQLAAPPPHTIGRWVLETSSSHDPQCPCSCVDAAHIGVRGVE